ncbi:MAG: LptF/LptG family permease, partial [Candidatus Omnitrophica bacterium]|nr:LptF/LptG family permease [Candidatus Omnitrophota bacterium]
MRILDRYLLKSVVTIFISCVFAFLFLYVVIDVLSTLEDILKHHFQIWLLVKYYLLYMPIMFVQVAPFACLLSTLYTLGRLNHNNEIIAMRSSGLSIFQITKDIIIFGLLVSFLVFWINDRFVPGALITTQKIRTQVTEGSTKIKDKKQETITNLSLYGLNNRLFFVNKFLTATNTMEGIIILEHDEHQNLMRKIVANKGVYQDGLWRFYQSITYDFDLNGQIIQEPIYMEEEIMSIPETPKDFVSQRQRTDNMSIAQLEDYIWKLSRSGANTVIRNLKIDLYQRYTTPFTNVIIILLGIPFSLIMRRRATGISSIGISILVGFLYYVLDAVCIAFGKGGILPPVLSASLSHIIAVIFATPNPQTIS